MKNKKIVIPVFIILLIVVIAIIIAVLSNGHRLINVYSHEGSVTYNRNSNVSDIIDGMQLISKDIVSTEDDSLLELLVDSDKHIIAKENTSFEILAKGNEDKGNVTINLLSGEALITIDNKLPDNSSFDVTTPNASLSVRGTSFTTVYDSDNDATLVSVTSGIVHAVSGESEMDIEAGNKVLIRNGVIEDLSVLEIMHLEYYYNESAGKYEYLEYIGDISNPGKLFVDRINIANYLYSEDSERRNFLYGLIDYQPYPVLEEDYVPNIKISYRYSNSEIINYIEEKDKIDFVLDFAHYLDNTFSSSIYEYLESDEFEYNKTITIDDFDIKEIVIEDMNGNTHVIPVHIDVFVNDRSQAYASVYVDTFYIDEYLDIFEIKEIL